MLSQSSFEKVFNVNREFIPNNILCYQKIQSKQYVMLSENKVEEDIEIRHSEMA